MPVWPRIICFKWAPRVRQGVRREQRAKCCVLHGAELSCRMHPASGTRVLQQWQQPQGMCWAWSHGKEKLPAGFFCSLFSLSPAVGGVAPATSEIVLYSSLYIDSDHVFLLLQKRSGVQSSYVTQISLLMANTSVCRRARKSSNKLEFRH